MTAAHIGKQIECLEFRDPNKTNTRLTTMIKDGINQLFKEHGIDPCKRIRGLRPLSSNISEELCRTLDFILPLEDKEDFDSVRGYVLALLEQLEKRAQVEKNVR